MCLVDKERVGNLIPVNVKYSITPCSVNHKLQHQLFHRCSVSRIVGSFPFTTEKVGLAEFEIRARYAGWEPPDNVDSLDGTYQ